MVFWRQLLCLTEMSTSTKTGKKALPPSVAPALVTTPPTPHRITDIVAPVEKTSGLQGIQSILLSIQDTMATSKDLTELKNKVHSVMSMLCYTLIIAFLIGIWAAPKSEDNVPLGSPATSDLSDTSCAKTLEGLKTSQNTDQRHPVPKKAEDQELRSASNIIVDPKLFQKRRFQSPRVLFSTQPPPLSRDEQSVEFLDNADSLNRNIRAKRDTHPVHNRGEYSVCDSISVWVANKTTATDIKGKPVTVMVDVNLNDNVYKQYFFETKCRNPKPVPSGCRGIDSRHWNSYCTTTHTFVKALTMEGNRASWRFIRIDTACVCVISRKTENF